jgi:hypothetical protein
MTGELRAKIQVVLLVALVIAATRTAYILHQRYEDAHPSAKGEISIGKPLDPDYYVTPRKLYPYDLKSAQELAKQPAWVRLGYAAVYFPYNPATHHADFGHPAGKFQPLEKLQVEKVVTDVAPGVSERQLMAVFTKAGSAYAFSVGNVSNHQYHFYGTDMLFIEDPHQLYRHWPSEVWQAIDQHQVKVGMNELQASMAIGLGIPQTPGDFGNRILNYPNDGHPVTVTFQGGKVVDVKSGT